MTEMRHVVTDDAVIVTDAKGRVTYLNPLAATMTGWTQHDAHAQAAATVCVLLDPRTRQPVENPVGQVLLHGVYVRLGGDDTLLIARDGAERTVKGSAAPLPASDGTLLGALLVFRAVAETAPDDEVGAGDARKTAILETALDCIIAMDHHGNIIEFNPSAERTFGHRRADVIGQELATLIIPLGQREAHREGLARHLATGEGPVLGKRIEMIALRADGSEFPVELAITRIPTAGPPQFTAYLRDISARLHTEQLRSVLFAVTHYLSQALDIGEAASGVLRAVCENLRWDVGFFWTVNDDSSALECIGSWHSPGLPVEQFAQASCSRTFSKHEGLPGRVWASGESTWILDVADATNFPRAATAAEEDVHSAFACPILMTGRTLGVIEFFTRRVREPDAELRETMATVAGHVGQFLERQRAEQALRENEEKLRLLADTIPQLAWMANGDGHIFWYNRRWYEYTGKMPAEMEGWGWQSVHDPAVLPEVLARWTGSIAHGEPFDMVFPLLGADGLFRPFLTRVNPLRDAEGRIVYWFGTNTDISDLKRMEDALRDADRRKDEFLATLAHELRNPLAPISNSLQILKMPGLDAATAIQAREMMERQIHHMVRLVDDLLDVSRVMRGKIELRKEPVELATVVARALETAHPLIAARGHRTEISFAEDSLLVDADPIRLAQVVGNLLTNAAKYTEANGHITVSAWRENAEAVLRVEDNGIGIGANMLPHIFDLFVQAEDAATRSQGGLGIGLTLVRNLMEMHSGTVEANSAGLGLGCAFTIRLPAMSQKYATAPVIADTHVAALSTSLRLLVVDDNEDAADSLGMLLRLRGHEVRIARDGTSALDIAVSYQPAVIFLDLGMPGMDGYEVARRLRKTPGLENTVIAALTGWGQVQDRRRTAHAGFDHHLVKPAETKALEDLLASVVQPNR